MAGHVKGERAYCAVQFRVTSRMSCLRLGGSGSKRACRRTPMHFVYILQCCDGCYDVGHWQNVPERVAAGDASSRHSNFERLALGASTPVTFCKIGGLTGQVLRTRRDFSNPAGSGWFMRQDCRGRRSGLRF
jgi:hypothetical protein